MLSELFQRGLQIRRHVSDVTEFPPSEIIAQPRLSTLDGDNEAVTVNPDIEPVEKPEGVPWIDPINKE